MVPERMSVVAMAVVAVAMAIQWDAAMAAVPLQMSVGAMV